MDEIKKQAELLAQEAEPGEKHYWFPHSNECRLLQITKHIEFCLDKQLPAFYFRPSLEDDLPFWTAHCICRPEEWENIKTTRLLSLPVGWDWEQAVEIKETVNVG